LKKKKKKKDALIDKFEIRLVSECLGLFHGAISQSGSVMSAWSLSENVGKYTRILAEHLLCSAATSHEIVQCLRSKRAEDIAASRPLMEVMFD